MLTEPAEAQQAFWVVTFAPPTASGDVHRAWFASERAKTSNAGRVDVTRYMQIPCAALSAQTVWPNGPD
jgi:hypothetical protein